MVSRIETALPTLPGRPTIRPVGVTVGAIQGGTKASIIPDEVKMLVSVRALDDKGRDRAN